MVAQNIKIYRYVGIKRQDIFIKITPYKIAECYTDTLCERRKVRAVHEKWMQPESVGRY